MTVSAKEFWQQMIRIGLVDLTTAKGLARAHESVIAKRKSSAPQTDAPATSVASFLVGQRVLTKFQAQRLLAGRSGELRLGEYLIVDRNDRSPLSRWFTARHLGRDGECLIYPCSDSMISPRWVDREWLRRHAAVNTPGLQSVRVMDLVASDPWLGVVISDLPSGRSMSGVRVDAETAAIIAQRIAMALAAMHAQDLIHGEVRPSRIWRGDDQTFCLLRDGGRPPMLPLETPQEHRWLDDDSAAEMYLAPELKADQDAPTSSSDQFSLAATVYSAVTGKPVCKPNEPYELPPDVAAARANGAAGDPLMRTLSYPLDPEPAHRFPDMSSLARAMEIVASTYRNAEPEQKVNKAAPHCVTLDHRAEPVAVDKDAVRQAEPLHTVLGPVETLAVRDLVVAEPEPEPIAVTPVLRNPVSSHPHSSSTPAEPPKRTRRKTRRSRRGPILVASAATLVLLVIFAVLLRPTAVEPVSTRPLPPPRAPVAIKPPVEIDRDEPPRPETLRPGTQPPETTGGFELVQDDRLLWASPWSVPTQPPPLDMLPPGAQMVITIRLARWFGEDAAVDWREWMDAEFSPALQSLENRAGVKAADIERLTIAFLPGEFGNPQVCFSIRPVAPMSAKTMMTRWSASPSRTPDGKTIYTGDSEDADAYFTVGIDDAIESFVFGPIQHIRSIAESDGSPMLLPRSMQQLWDASSDEADIAVLAIPNFLFADGRELLATYAPGSIDGLRALMIPDIAAATMSMSVTGRWFGEVRVTPSGSISSPSLMKKLESRVESLPDWAESFVVNNDVDPSWRAMAIRLPQYMRAMKQQSRFGISDALPVANFYLPVDAAPQITLAATLALAPHSPAPVAEMAMPTSPAMSAEQLVDVKFSVSFDQESLEFAVAAIGDEFARVVPQGSTKPTITIIGNDLEKSGITQNQQIRNFAIRDQPLREALSEIVRQANPDKTATSLADPKQVLVWAIDAASTTEQPKLLVTTRLGAETRKAIVPKEFSGD